MSNDVLDIKHLFGLSSDKNQLLLSIYYLHENIALKIIVTLIKQSEYNAFKVDIDALKVAIEYFSNEREQERSINVDTTFVIGERVDAQLIIDISDDKLTAKGQIITAYAGKNIDTDKFVAALKKSEIKFGIIKPAIMLLIKKARQAAPGLSIQITIAKGIPPKNGINATFISLIEAPKVKLADAMKAQYGSVNFQEIEKLLAVNPGTKLVRKIPAKKGHQGKAVTGEILNFTESIDIPFCINHNTAIAPDDNNLLISTAHGTPVALKVGITIEPILILQDVDPASGPVHHDGCLIIKGDVAPGSQITATGDITIVGFIESSSVKCGGSLYVSKGIIGEQIDEFSQDYSSQVECDGAIFTNFIQFSKISSKSDINISSQLIHSAVLCSGYINVKDKLGKKGAIFGGFLCSHKGINTVTLGAIAGIQTTIDLIGPYHQLLDKKKQISTAISELKDKISHAVTAQQKVNLAPESEHATLLNKRLTLTIIDAKKQLDSCNNQLNLAQSNIQNYINSTKVTALKAIHSKVSVSIADDVFKTHKKYGATTLHMKNMQLIAESYAGE